MAKVAASGLFDPHWYLMRYPDVADTSLDPLTHYFNHGSLEGRDPNILFDTSWYRDTHLRGDDRAINPLAHFVTVGRAAGLEARPPAAAPKWPPMPDDAVHVERLAGLEFFARHQITPDGDVVPQQLSAIVNELAERDPTLAIDHNNPDVSIIVSTKGGIGLTLNCLDSLSRHASIRRAEIVVVDSTPAESQIEQIAAIPWLRYVRNPSRHIPSDRRENAARPAGDRFLVFLDARTRVVADWLDELIASFDAFPSASEVISKHLDCDGKLDWHDERSDADGGRWSRESNSPKHCFARQIQVGPALSFAVPARLWRALHASGQSVASEGQRPDGLDAQVSAGGDQTWLQPYSRVIRYGARVREAADVGDADGAGAGGQQGARARTNTSRPRMLMIDRIVPRPDRDAGSVIAAKTIEALRSEGWHVILAPLHVRHYDPRYTRELQRMGVECLYSPHYTSLAEILRDYGDVDAILVFRVEVAAPELGLLARRPRGVPLLFHTVDLHYQRERRAAELTGDREVHRKAEATRTAELTVIEESDCAIVVTDKDREAVDSELAIDHILEIPYAIDVRRSTVPWDARQDVMFLGGFDHSPNVDAMAFFTSAVWPLLEDRLPPSARLLIVGSDPPAEFAALESDRILVTGYVPELAPYFDRARVFVAPLRYGAGIKGKVLQSMAHGVPTVLTRIAAEGIPIRDREHALISDTPESTADSVIELFTDQVRWHRIQEAAFAVIEANYSWDQWVDRWRQAIETARRRRASRNMTQAAGDGMQ